MILQEFITSTLGDNPGLTDEDLLALAQAENTVVGAYINRNTMNSLMAQNGIYSAVKAVAATDGHPAQDAFAAFIDSVEFNFIQNDSTGAIQIAMLDGLIAANITQPMGESNVNISTGLANIKPILLAISNKITLAYPSVTLGQIKAITRIATELECFYLGDEGKLVTTNHNQDKFVFEVSATEAYPPIMLRVEWKTGESESYIKHSQKLILPEGDSGLNSHSMKRMLSLIGLNSARHVRFFYTPQFAGQITSITASVSN